MKTPPQFDSHHSIPVSRYGKKTGQNVRIMIKKIHDRLHLLFENKTPKEQLEMMLDINANVITKKVRHAIRNILEDENMVYRE